MLYCVFKKRCECSQAGRAGRDLRPGGRQSVCGSVSLQGTVRGRERRLANFGAAQKVATARDEKLGQVKVNPGVGMLQCCQVFALHCSFPHTVSPSPFTFCTVSQFSHTKVQCEHLNPKTQKPKTKTQTRTRSSTSNRKSEVLHSICEQAANHQSPSPARTGDRQRQQRLQLQSCSSEMRNSLFI